VIDDDVPVLEVLEDFLALLVYASQAATTGVEGRSSTKTPRSRRCGVLRPEEHDQLAVVVGSLKMATVIVPPTLNDWQKVREQLKALHNVLRERVPGT